MHLKRVRKQCSGERLVVAADALMVGLFDVDLHNGRGQRDDLVGVQVVRVFVRKILVGDQRFVLDEATDIGTGSTMCNWASTTSTGVYTMPRLSAVSLNALVKNSL